MRELGPYLLLRKLSEDALSETYRAGQRSGEDVERVVLLYTLKSDAEAAHWLADTATVGHRALKGLNSHTIATVVDSGEIDGAAYLAYDYISGIRLNQLFRESRDKGIPLPMDLALLIADRLAQGLLDAWEHESRMLHGFLVPHLVMISTEGDARVLGIEVAGRLRRLLTEKEIHDEVRPYLGPEVVPESQASTIDDVYSLGALLFELTTGTQPPPATFDDVENAIAEATTADGSEIPADVRSLLESSLAKSMRRIDLKTWHSELNDLIVSGQYEASPFSLALFLHQLFGDTLDEADGSGSRDSSEDSDAKLAELEAQVTALQELERQLAEPDTTDGSADADEHQTINPEDPILGDLPEPDGPSDELSSDEFFADVSDSVAAKLPTPVPKPASRGRGLKMAAAAALVLLAVGIGYFALRQEPISADSGPVARQEAEQSAPEEIVRTTAPEAADPAEVTTTEAKADLPAVTPSPPKPTPSRSTPVRARGPSQKDSSATASQRTKLSGDSAEKAPVEEATNSGSRIVSRVDGGEAVGPGQRACHRDSPAHRFPANALGVSKDSGSNPRQDPAGYRAESKTCSATRQEGSAARRPDRPAGLTRSGGHATPPQEIDSARLSDDGPPPQQESGGVAANPDR
jgi:hypothetical protein